MEMQTASAIEAIKKICLVSKGSEMDASKLESIDDELALVASLVNGNKTQALLVAIILHCNLMDKEGGIDNLAEFLAVSPTELLPSFVGLTEIFRRGLIEKITNRFHPSPRVLTGNYSISRNLFDAILNNSPMAEPPAEDQNNPVKLLGSISKLAEKREWDESDTAELIFESRQLVEKSSELPLIKWLMNFELTFDDLLLFLLLTWKQLNGNKNYHAHRLLETIYDSPVRVIEVILELQSKSHQLCTLGLIELEEAEFANDLVIKLSISTLLTMSELGLSIMRMKQLNEKMLPSDKIREKELIFNDQGKEQLTSLSKLLCNNNLPSIIERLEARNMPKGILILFHGQPGTGKTEFAYQVARQTGRDIMQVDISSCKTKWYGESQKLVKAVFTDYATSTKSCPKTPILLINEADALLSRRMQNVDAPSSQTENAIQNILLEEMERFEGILIATTNLVRNLDSAFERRFLYKVEFVKPDLQARTRIWQSKIPHLSETECSELACRFEFSGAQIENISRKCEIELVIGGKEGSFGQILEYCREETLEVKTAGIGYRKLD